MNPSLQQFAEALAARLGSRISRVPSACGELTFEVAAASLREVCGTLRDDPECRFEQLIDLAGVDYIAYGRSEWTTLAATGSGFSRGRAGGDSVAGEPARRFAVVYHLMSVTHNRRLRLRAWCEGVEPPCLDSVTDIWKSADWYEREAFDLYGVLFRGHPDLRRILTDYGFVGHPFRKDFPLIGNVEVRYDPARGRVVYEPVSIEPRTLVPRVIREDTRHVAAKDAAGHG